MCYKRPKGRVTYKQVTFQRLLHNKLETFPYADDVCELRYFALHSGVRAELGKDLNIRRCIKSCCNKIPL